MKASLGIHKVCAVDVIFFMHMRFLRCLFDRKPAGEFSLSSSHDASFSFQIDEVG